MSKKKTQQDFIRITDLPSCRNECFVSAYSNHIKADQGCYDLQLTFCQILKDVQGQLVVQEQARIAITWEHAAKLQNLLARMIAIYENDHGQIRGIKEPITAGQLAAKGTE